MALLVFLQRTNTMKTSKLLKALAVASVMAPLGVQAAIDDMGMQYVSAAEGFSGSFRLNLFESVDDGSANASDNNKLGSVDSLRLYLGGTSDLGGGMSSSYALELRNATAVDQDGGLHTIFSVHNWNVGLSGAFGLVNVGRTTQAAFMVPGGSLDSIAGSNASAVSVDPDNNVIVYKSPVIQGMQFGVSGRALGVEVSGEDDLLDQYDLAATYSSPLGFTVGAAYEVKLVHDSALSATEKPANDDKTGFRFGVRYGQDNWLVAYEYRAYDNHLAFGAGSFSGHVALATTSINTTNPALISVNAIYNNSLDWNNKVSYNVHRIAAKVSIDKITASANYSKEAQELDVSFAGITNEVGRTKLGIDVAYALGAKSMVAFGWTNETEEAWSTSAGRLLVSSSNVSKVKDGVTTTKLWYRVDF